MAPERAYLIVSQAGGVLRGRPRPGVLIRRHPPGRHRVDAAAPRHYRPACPRDGTVVRPGPGAVRLSRLGHALAHDAGDTRGRTLAGYAVVTLSVLVSGWFAASGASAFAQLVGP